MVSATVSPAKATRPVSISKSTHPNAQMSVRLSTARPRACSGLMQAAVPMTAPSRRCSHDQRLIREVVVARGDDGLRQAEIQYSTTP